MLRCLAAYLDACLTCLTAAYPACLPAAKSIRSWCRTAARLSRKMPSHSTPTPTCSKVRACICVHASMCVRLRVWSACVCMCASVCMGFYTLHAPGCMHLRAYSFVCIYLLCACSFVHVYVGICACARAGVCIHVCLKSCVRLVSLPTVILQACVCACASTLEYV